jgi:predicted RNA-binding Zn ribbon-like protein
MGTMHDTKHVHEKEFSEVAGWPALDFVNTVSGLVRGVLTEDMFDEYADLVAWGRTHELLEDSVADRLLSRAERYPGKAKEIVERGRTLRLAIYRVFSDVSAGRSPDMSALERINSELADAMQHARIEPEVEGFRWGWRDAGAELESVLWPVAKSAADLLVSHKLDRVRSCQGETCGWLFLDMSKNRSRRWCSMSDCGNTAKARRHYRRKVKGETDGY